VPWHGVTNRGEYYGQKKKVQDKGFVDFIWNHQVEDKVSEEEDSYGSKNSEEEEDGVLMTKYQNFQVDNHDDNKIN